MKFHICNLEPPNYPYGHFLDDACRLFAYSLESLGYSCSMACNQIEPECVNIVFGGQFLSQATQVDSLAGACRYIAIQHEILNADGVNLTRDKQRLQDVYLPFLRRAFAVWEGLPANLESLRRFGIRASTYRGGYHPDLCDVRWKKEQDIDFLFFGSITPYRRQMLEQLSEHTHRVVAVFDPRQHYRNDLIARAKVQLAPMQGPETKHFAYGRVSYLLNNERLVVVERCQDQEWLEHCFVTAPSEHWVDVCQQTLSRSDREDIRREFADRYRQMPFTDQLERLLDETFNGHQGPAAEDAAAVAGLASGPYDSSATSRTSGGRN